MKINIFIVAISVIILTVLSAAGFFIYKNLNKPEVKEQEKTEAASSGGEPHPENSGREVLQETKLIKDNFEVTLPAGWKELTNPPEGVLLMAIDSREDISGGNFQKLDFRTNFSVKTDDLTRYAAVSSLETYIESIKTSLVQMLPGINFTKEEQKTINGNRAILIECASRQEEADFKTLIVFVKGNDNIIYAISFNTFQDFWENYKGVFEQIAESFKLKYKIEL